VSRSSVDALRTRPTRKPDRYATVAAKETQVLDTLHAAPAGTLGRFAEPAWMAGACNRAHVLAFERSARPDSGLHPPAARQGRDRPRLRARARRRDARARRACVDCLLRSQLQAGLRRNAASVPAPPANRACDRTAPRHGASVTQLSVEVGFHSLGSFSTAFRELVGESPAAYARRWRAMSAPPIPACFTLMYTRPHESPPGGAELGSFREAPPHVEK
jgi:AraC-like DNA-binding protein